MFVCFQHFAALCNCVAVIKARLVNEQMNSAAYGGKGCSLIVLKTL